MEKARSSGSRSPNSAVTLLAIGSEDDLLCLRNICAGTGWTVHETHALQQGLAELRQNAFPVVLCQYTLPDGDWKGMRDAAFGLREPPYLIVWSRLADASLWAEVLNLGGHDVLAAPFRVAEVVHTVNAAIRKWRERRASLGKAQALAPAV